MIIRLGTVPGAKRPTSIDEGGNGVWCEGDEAVHYRTETGAAWITAGREIVFEPEGDPDDSLVRLALTGPALGLALMQRGCFLLHGSAVAIDDRAVVFLGTHAAGKSTMAAALTGIGHALVTDDIALLEHADRGVQIVPSFPQLKLWDDAAKKLGLEGDLPRVHPDHDKWAWRLQAGTVDQPLPLAGLYVLGIGDELRVERLSPIEGSQFVISNWYGARFGETLYRSRDEGAHFRQCVEVAGAVPIRRLWRPPVEGDFAAHAREVAAAIRADLAAD